MLRRERRQYGLDDIPVASFSDIAFLLIIFFILTTTLVATRGFLTDFPAGQRSEKQDEKKATTVTLRDGKVLLNNSPVDIPTLRKELRALNLRDRTGDDKVVMLESAGRVEYREYFQVMAAVTQAGGTLCIVRETGGD
ncbi:MAG TPA: biopolymer transporter ExbD [Planctomycetota bacterium]|nr:biopolymer transporter ExbD [Planctomycetota bacterium]HRT97022.1 biopolymer transporter ExbD [Planctomycetota bacterium]